MFEAYIKTIGNKHASNVIINEIEFRLGEMSQSGFITGCTISKFREISEEYLKGYSITPESSYLLTIDNGDSRVRLHSSSLSGFNEYVNSGVITNSMSYEVIKKNRIEVDDSQNDYNFRLNVAHEEKLPSEIAQKGNTANKTFRLAQRWSYTLFPGIIVDMSCIKQCTGRTFKEGVVNMSAEKYEIEIDIARPSLLLEHSGLIDMHLTRMLLILNGYIKIQKQSILNGVFSDYSKKYDPRLFAQNVPLTNSILKKLDKEDLVVDDKADGDRYLMYTTDSGEIYLISGKQKVLWTGLVQPSLANSLFDGELLIDATKMKSEYHIFDVIYYLGRDMRDMPFYSEDDLSIYEEMNDSIIGDSETKIKLTDRIFLKKWTWFNKSAKPTSKISLKKTLNAINEFSGDNKRTIKYLEKKEIVPSIIDRRYTTIISSINPEELQTDNFIIKPKYFYPLRMLVFLNKYDIININEEKQQLSKGSFYELDGLIIQNKNGIYPRQIKAGINPQWNDSYKWKFTNSVSIDFEMVFKAKIGDEMTCLLRGGAFDLQQNFKIVDSKVRTISGDVICNGNIVEFCRGINNLWIPHRIRDDKTKPNSVHTIMTTLELLDNPVSIVDLV